MQSSKTRNGPSDVSQKTSSAAPRSARATKSCESDSSSTKHTPTKTPTERSPKVIERRSPRSPVTEKRRPPRVAELESQLSQLQEDLKKTKEQLSSTESSKRQAQHDAKDAKKQLETISKKLEDSQHQLVEFSAAEESRLQELRKISQDRDQVWQSELEAVQKQHSVDSAALVSAMNEIQTLKGQLLMVFNSESNQAQQSEIAQSELDTLKHDMAGTLSTVESLKVQLRESEKAEAEAEALVIEAQQQLEVAKITVETLRSEGLKLMDSFSSTNYDLEQSKTRISSLEEYVKKLQADQVFSVNSSTSESLELEVEQLRYALKETEFKYQEEHEKMAKQVKTDSGMRESELEVALKNAEAELAELKANLLDKETELQSIADMNLELKAKLERNHVHQTEHELEMRLTQSVVDVAELKANLMDKETELQSISEENEMLKQEIRKKEMENNRKYEAAIAEIELAKAKEKEMSMKLSYVTEEADKSSRRSAKVTEQLEAAQAVNSEMETELRRLRVQSDQWRKAAEAAAAVLTTGNNGSLVERSGSLDSAYNSVAGKLMSSPFSDDLDDESTKKKNSNMLRRIGGLWKKSPK